MSARKEWMNDDQWECWQLIGKLWGFNHVYNKPKPLTVKKYSGIEINLPVHNMATFDYDDLTRFVFLCHDMQIRGSIHGSGPNLVKINLWKRQNRDGTFSERHPTLETAVEKWRKEEAKKEALAQLEKDAPYFVWHGDRPYLPYMRYYTGEGMKFYEARSNQASNEINRGRWVEWEHCEKIEVTR